MGFVLEGNFITTIDSSDSIERNEKQTEYINYIESHRERVKAAYEKHLTEPCRRCIPELKEEPTEDGE